MEVTPGHRPTSPGYELASSFDLPVISLRLLLPRLLRPSSCHLHRVRSNIFLPPSILTPICLPRPPSLQTPLSYFVLLLSLSLSLSLMFFPPLHFAKKTQHYV